MGRLGLDRTDDFQKIYGPGLVGSNFIGSGQDWTGTEKFHSPFISAVYDSLATLEAMFFSDFMKNYLIILGTLGRCKYDINCISIHEFAGLFYLVFCVCSFPE